METIILIGPKHSGKTCAGKALASLYSCDFIDLDELIFQRTEKSPRQLFNEGQTVFQKAEAEAAAAFFAESDGGGKRRVIAAGGGIIDNAQAATLLNMTDTVIVYLNISAESAWDRIAHAEELPPFLRTENPQETHRDLHERRAAAYLQIADIVIEVEEKTPEEIGKEIMNRIF